MRPRDRQRRRHTRRHAFRPGAEGLEPRIALSGASIGTNLDGNSSYANNPIWTDLHNVANAWTPASGSSLALSADGYPLASASTGFCIMNYPSGNYQFSYTGSGTVSFYGAGQLVGSVTVSGGVTSGTVAVTQGAYPDAYMQVTNVNPSNPMDNFHFMMPGYGNGTTPEPMFTPAFIQSLAPFSNIRFMDWENINGSTVTNWSDRVPANAFLTDGAGGVPYEDMIELCNESQKDMWINIPALATPQFVRSLAQLVDSKLDPNLNVYVEYGNEDWNNAFQAYAQIAKAAAANPVLNQSLGQYQLVAQQSAFTLVNDGQIFDQVFGTAGAARVRPVLGGQESWDQFQTYGLQFIKQYFGPPSQYIYGQAVAPYVDGNGDANTPGLTLDQLFADMEKNLTQNIIPQIQADAALDAQYGVPLMAYEGGQGLSPGNNDANYGVMLQAQSDPRMFQLYTNLMQAWVQAGAGVFDAFMLTGTPSQYGYWGVLPNVLAVGSQRYDALLASAYAGGDANTDGSVDFADFQAIQANYGADGMHWVQGDTNDDGIVNWADLNTMRQDLDPAGFTPGQFAQQALFGQESTVDTPTALEYDGYGVAQASTMALIATSGTVVPNQTAAGQPIVLNGASYAQGLGFAANSSTTLSLNGQYAQFDSTIGVDSSGSAASSVIFQVYGDNQLLYQSPVIASGSAGVPIDLSVAGVKSLTLVVDSAPGSDASADHAVWADARLISTANFGATAPDTLTWQLSQNGQVISTQTADSFVFPAVSGTYTLSLTVTDAGGHQGTASTNVTVVPDNPSASFALKDSFTGGSWIGDYGAQGYDLAGLASGLPAYADVSISGASNYSWTSGTNDARALLNPSGSLRAANCWYSTSSFTIDVNLTDGQAHDLALYAVDWANSGRSESIQLIDPSTGNVLDTETLSSFGAGAYLQWAVSGHVQIKVTDLSGPNAVISGLLFDAAPSTPSPLVQRNGTTQGNWIGTFGSQGYDLAGVGSNLPSYASISVIGAGTWTFASSTGDSRGLQNPGGSGRAAIAWVSSSTFTIDVNLTDGQVHDLAIYADDFDQVGRDEQIQLIDPSTGSVLDTETLTSFTGGVYLQWAVSGHVQIVLRNYSGYNAAVGGVFLDASAQSAQSDPSGPPTASFAKKDTGTQGSWIGAYGSQGSDIEGDAPTLPSYAAVSLFGASTYTWTSNTNDARALQNPGGSGRAANCWYSTSSFTIDVNLTDGQVHDLALYAVDWVNAGRSERIQLVDPATGNVLDTETLSSFGGGAYIQWAVSGHVQIKLTTLAGPNAVVSGLFIDPANTSFVKEDTGTAGNWIGAYGSQGSDIEGDASSLPSYANVSLSGASTYTWTSNTNDARALQNPGGSGLAANCWYSTSSFTIDVDLTDGQVHDLALYAVDWVNAGRSERIQLVDPSTGNVLDTETLTSFGGGAYIQWAVSGHVQIKLTTLAGPNAVVSGLFIDPANTSFVKEDTGTAGNWIGAYGSQGNDIEGDASSLPSYANVSLSGASTYTWTSSTNDTRALQNPGGSGRAANCWYSTSSFTIDVNLTDGQVHDLALYAVDWVNAGRSESIQLIDPSTGSVLDTETLTSFGGGAYIQWAVSGHVQIKVTTLAGPNAVVSGLFID